MHIVEKMNELAALHDKYIVAWRHKDGLINRWQEFNHYDDAEQYLARMLPAAIRMDYKFIACP